MMTIKLKDRTEVVVSDEQGQKVQDSILNDAQFIKLNNQLYSRNSIDQVVSGGQAPEKFIDPWANLSSGIPAGKRCTGSHSIQNEINQIVKAEHPKDWARVIRDDTLREQIRANLRVDGVEWCDYRAGECACQ